MSSRIIELLREDAEADIDPLPAQIDDAIFDLFEVRSQREEVRRFYRTVGRVETVQAAAAEGA